MGVEGGKSVGIDRPPAPRGDAVVVSNGGDTSLDCEQGAGTGIAEVAKLENPTNEKSSCFSSGPDHGHVFVGRGREGRWIPMRVRTYVLAATASRRKVLQGGVSQSI